MEVECPISSVPIIKISDARCKVDPIFIVDRQTDLFTPGQTVTSGAGLMRGHGTYADEEDVKSSAAGVLVKVNKLIIVRPIKCRYTGQIGDVVVGRITEIQQKRWKVDMNYRLHGTLMLSSLNLPGGELRRRGVEDERMMRKYFTEGDLLSAEVQNMYSDGSLFLHTRSLKYGKLNNGFLINVYPSLIKRCKTHFIQVRGMSVILGINGLIWIQMSSEENQMGGFSKNMNLAISYKEADDLIRLKNSILALASSRLLIYDTSIESALAASMKYQLHELCKPEVMLDIAITSEQNLNSEHS